MPKTLKEKNAMECNRKARAKYLSSYNEKMGLKIQSTRFKIEEVEEIDAYCKKNDVVKSDLIREAVLTHIRKKENN